MWSSCQASSGFTDHRVYLYSWVFKLLYREQVALWNNATVTVMLLIFNIIRGEDIHSVMWETALYTLPEETVTQHQTMCPHTHDCIQKDFYKLSQVDIIESDIQGSLSWLLVHMQKMQLRIVHIFSYFTTDYAFNSKALLFDCELIHKLTSKMFYERSTIKLRHLLTDKHCSIFFLTTDI